MIILERQNSGNGISAIAKPLELSELFLFWLLFTQCRGAEIFKHLGKKFIFKPAGPPMMICHDQEYKESDVDVEVAVPIGKEIKGTDRIKVYELEGIEAACTVYKGAYDGIGEAYKALMAWIEGNGYQITGNDRELYFTEPGKMKDPAENITEIQFPVKKL